MNNWNMKKIVLYLLATMFIAYGLGAVVFFSSSKTSFNGTKGNYDINEEKAANINGIKEIKVSVASPDINIIPVDGSEIKAQLNGKIISSGPYTKPELEFSTSGDSLYINVNSKTNMVIGFFSSSLKLDIYIPSSYSDTLKLSSSSGDLNVKNLKLSNLECNASSGNANIENVSADNFVYNSSSGSLKADKLTTKTSKLSNSSGSKRATGFTGDLKVSSSSGDTKIDYAAFDNNINVDSSSGSVEIKLPESSNFYLSAHTSSGGIKTDFPITVKGETGRHELIGTVGSDKNKIKINTSSGSIKILK
ncbi:hypothetical protein HMPREF1982_02764 [Clostridiales bacterium oral taxon 876 str. F0540]|nr:hypothetical protein HMPREF1982_02764 [Clostridiales bacterium oral taxon 876 str. F0540]